MKNKLKLIYIIIFFAICITPVLTMPFFSVGTSERESMNSAPSVIDDGSLNLDYFTELDDYLSTSFNFRSQLISANATIMEQVFSTSSASNVIVGKDDWLFFADTLDDYNSENVLSDDEIDDIVKTLDLVNEYWELQGSEFLFTIAPNKNSIYPEYMPDNYIGSDEPNNAEKLGEAIGDEYYLDMFEVLRDNEEILYLKRDSHWNNLGAYIGFEAILEALGIEEVGFNITSTEIRNEFEADLEEMLYPVNPELDEQIYYTYDTEYEYHSNFKSVDDLDITTHNQFIEDNGENSAVVYRDSFGNALLELFGMQFTSVDYSRAVPYRMTYETDYVIIELVERNIPNLLEKAPAMQAIERTDVSATLAENAVIETKTTYTLNNIYGYINVEGVENIYVEYEGRMYEAFPILESSLEITDKTGISGFSMYLGFNETVEINTDDIKIYYN